MAVYTISLVHKHHITALATFGETGYCGHADHVATHQAALTAQTIMRNNGKEIPILALRTDQQGEVSVPVNAQRKLSALAFHASQFKTTPDGKVDSDFWQYERSGYNPLLAQESYDVL